jgi:hypothetical protein
MCRTVKSGKGVPMVHEPVQYNQGTVMTDKSTRHHGVIPQKTASLLWTVVRNSNLEEVKRGWRKMYKEELHESYYSKDIIKMNE